MIEDMEMRLIGGPSVKFNDDQKKEFKKHRQQAEALKKKNNFEREQLDKEKEIEDQELKKDPFSASAMKYKGDSKAETDHLRQVVKKLQKKFAQAEQDYKDLQRESNDQKQEMLFLLGQNETDIKF